MTQSNPKAKASFHITECHIHSAKRHNLRLKEMPHVRADLSQFNDHFIAIDDLAGHYEKLASLVKEKTGRKMQEKAKPIREGVLNITEQTTLEDVKRFADALNERYGIKTLQISLHRDEGHMKAVDDEPDNPKIWKPNLHAHVVMQFIDEETGKSIKLSKKDCSDIQTLAAELLDMQRGVSSDVKHLNAVQYKVQATEKALQLTKNRHDELQSKSNELEQVIEQQEQTFIEQKDDQEQALAILQHQNKKISKKLLRRKKQYEEFRQYQANSKELTKEIEQQRKTLEENADTIQEAKAATEQIQRLKAQDAELKAEIKSSNELLNRLNTEIKQSQQHASNDDRILGYRLREKKPIVYQAINSLFALPSNYLPNATFTEALHDYCNNNTVNVIATDESGETFTVPTKLFRVSLTQKNIENTTPGTRILHTSGVSIAKYIEQTKEKRELAKSKSEAKKRSMRL